MVQFQVVGAPVEHWPQPGIHIANYGNGLALIKSLTLYVDGKPVQPVGQSAGFEEAAKLLGLLDRTDLQITFALSISEALPAGQSKLLIGMEKDAYTSERGAVLNGALKHISMRVRYESLYHEVFEAALMQP